MKYIKVDWPDVQEFMTNPNWNEECYFDPIKNAWFIPEDWDEDTCDAIDEAQRALAWHIHELIYHKYSISFIDKYVTDICDF